MAKRYGFGTARFSAVPFFKRNWLVLLIIALVVLFWKKIMNMFSNVKKVVSEVKEGTDKVFIGTPGLIGVGAAVWNNLFGTTKTDEVVNSYINDQKSVFDSKTFVLMQKTVPAGSVQVTLPALKDLVKRIYDSRGWFSDDFDKMFSAFKMLHTQFQVARLSQVWYDTYNVELLTYLKGKDIWPNDGFNSENILKVIDYVNKLPKY